MLLTGMPVFTISHYIKAGCTCTGAPPQYLRCSYPSRSSSRAASGMRISSLELPGRVTAGRSVSVPVGLVAPGDEIKVQVKLGKGKWDLGASYASRLPLMVDALGLQVSLPKNLDRLGPRWPIGRIDVRRAGDVSVTFMSKKRWLTPASSVANVDKVIATPVGSERIVPLSSACGEYVDWYRVKKNRHRL